LVNCFIQELEQRLMPGGYFIQYYVGDNRPLRNFAPVLRKAPLSRLCSSRIESAQNVKKGSSFQNTYENSTVIYSAFLEMWGRL
jgi:hypothetical protein